MAKRGTKQETKLTNQNLDVLSDLGLDLDAGAPAGEVKQENPEVARTSEVKTGGIKRGKLAEIPAAVRTGGGGKSKFPFAELAAPEKDKKGTVIGYDYFEVEYAGGDEKKFRRAVQSATTQANRGDAAKYFVSRSVTDKDGKFTGIQVIRTDERPAE
jgi:hypothetical protein